MSALARLPHPPRRLSVPLTAEDEAELDRIRASSAGIASLPGVDAASSDAQLVHAVFAQGLVRVREAEEAAEYAALARDEEWTAAEARRRSGRSRASRPDLFEKL